ncbi:hypothetical protein CHS0354_036796 [Potamilus streckersoni]|uniref:Uncharacterized protein n=1 Tax=Potamilus streckersoni TaxID=2493646 RepID=A0AAE0SJ36_9BIVA|nr:hypothetical protein CHS0354_036796 [Potamilus streckersoni]
MASTNVLGRKTIKAIRKWTLPLASKPKSPQSFSQYGEHEKITISNCKPYQYARDRDLFPLNTGQQNRCAGTKAGSSLENTTKKTERREMEIYSPNPTSSIQNPLEIEAEPQEKKGKRINETTTENKEADNENKSRKMQIPTTPYYR